MAFVETKPITYGTAGNDYISGGGIASANGPVPATSGVKYATGLDFNGNAGAVRLYGGEGNDTLYGTNMCDTLVGGGGTDLLRGGLGCDQLYGNAGSDQFYFRFGDLGTTYVAGTVVTAAMWNPQTGGDMIMDFQGAGRWFATNNDFISFNGFGTAAEGARVDYLGTVAGFPTAAVYAVTAAATKGGGINLFTVQLDGGGATQLVSGDYQFNA